MVDVNTSLGNARVQWAETASACLARALQRSRVRRHQAR
jgi:hypothetical protein